MFDGDSTEFKWAPVVPHKAVAPQVSKTGHSRRGEML